MFEDILGEKKKQRLIEIFCPECDYVIAWQLLVEGENEIEWPKNCPNCDRRAQDVRVRTKNV